MDKTQTGAEGTSQNGMDEGNINELDMAAYKAKLHKMQRENGKRPKMAEVLAALSNEKSKK